MCQSNRSQISVISLALVSNIANIVSAVVADCFALFQRLMEQVEPLFASMASGGQVVRHGDSASSKAADREYGVKVALSPVLAMCFHVQG